MTRQILTPGVPQETTDVTRDQLRAQLDALNIPYTTRDTKPELQAKLDAAQQPAPVQTPAPAIQPDIDPAAVSVATAAPPQGLVVYEAVLEDCNRAINGYKQQIHALETENAELRAQRDARTTGAPAPAPQQISGMVLTDQGYVVS